MACDRTFENIIGTYIKLYDSGFEMKKKHERLTGYCVVGVTRAAISVTVGRL